MLTTVSFEDFMAIDNDELSEAKKNFNLSEFEDLPLRDMNSYLTKQCGIPVKGRGSSREVFFLSKSNLSMVKGPSCLKLARIDGNKPIDAGIAQNREETNILKKYQDKHACFPWLYYNDVNNYFMIVELGTPFDSTPKSFVSYQFDPIKETIEDFLDEFDYPSYDLSYALDDWLKNVSKKFEFTDFISGLAKTIANQSGTILSKSDAIWIDEFIHAIKNSKDPITYSIYATLNFALQKEAKSLLWNDFIQPENWAFVKRNNYFMLIPIDWGFTKSVSQNYYS